MIGSDVELLKVYVPKTVKRKLEAAAGLAGVKTSNFVCASLTEITRNKEDYDLAIQFLEAAISLETQAVKNRVAEKLEELRAIAGNG